MTQQWNAEALRESLLWTASSLAALGKEQDVIVLEGRRRTVAEILDEANDALEVDTPPASAQDDAKDERQAQPIKLVHLAVAEDGGIRFITGRKLPDGIESCELYAMPDYGRAPAELFHAPAAGDARSPVLNIEAAAKALAECMDYPWAHMPEQGRAAMREHAQTVIRAASQQQEG